MQHLTKLTRLEEHLTTLLEKIDQEIIQTDIEWLHLKSIAEELNSSNTPSKLSGSGEATDSKPKNTGGITTHKVKLEFDAPETNREELRLDPYMKNTWEEDEESDSDSH